MQVWSNTVNNAACIYMEDENAHTLRLSGRSCSIFVVFLSQILTVNAALTVGRASWLGRRTGCWTMKLRVDQHKPTQTGNMPLEVPLYERGAALIPPKQTPGTGWRTGPLCCPCFSLLNVSGASNARQTETILLRFVS